MQCNKLGKGFLKVKAKVSGFLIAKVEKKDVQKQIAVVQKKNTILSSGIQYLLNAFQTYMSGVNYLGTSAPSPGIVITTSSGNTYTLPFVTTPAVSATSNSAIISFTVMDDSPNSYTATSEQLITQSAGYNIPIATASLSVTKQSDEILTMTWIITISISTSENLTYIQALTPQSGGSNNEGYIDTGCGICATSGANSEYPQHAESSSLVGLSSQYPNLNFITTQLFTDMVYNGYGKGSSNSFTYVSGTTLIIYTQYCTTYFFAGAGNIASFNPSGDEACYTSNTTVDPVYLQIYSPSETSAYIGVQIEFST